MFTSATSAAKVVVIRTAVAILRALVVALARQGGVVTSSKGKTYVS